MTRNKTGKRSSVGENSDFIHLTDNSVENLASERTKHDSMVGDGVKYVAPVGLDEPSTDLIDGRDGNDESMPENTERNFATIKLVQSLKFFSQRVAFSAFCEKIHNIRKEATLESSVD